MRSWMRSLSKRRVSWGVVWMKVLFINDFHQYSGAEKVVNSLVYWLKKLGHETLLITHEEIHNLDKIIIKFKPDLINQHNFSLFGPVALKYSEKIPFVQTIHDYWIVCKTRHHYLYREDRICPYYNFDNCDNCPNILGSLPMPQQSKKLFADIQLTTVSNYVKNVLVKFGFNPDNIHVIHNGIEIKDLEPKDMNFVFCTAKNPAQIKGARFFAEVASRLPYKFMLSGTTSYSGVTNLGFLPEDKLFNMYKNCSIFVFPSVWEEPCLPDDTIIYVDKFNTVGLTNNIVETDVIAINKRWYDDLMIQIVLEDDTVLKLTKNHPVLTEFGFLPAKLLQKGFKVATPKYNYGLSQMDERRIEDFAKELFKCKKRRFIVTASKSNLGRDSEERISIENWKNQVYAVLCINKFKRGNNCLFGWYNRWRWNNWNYENSQKGQKKKNAIYTIYLHNQYKRKFDGFSFKNYQGKNSFASHTVAEKTLLSIFNTWLSSMRTSKENDKIFSYQKKAGEVIGAISQFKEKKQVFHRGRRVDFSKIKGIKFKKIKKIEVFRTSEWVFNLQTKSQNYVANDIIVHNCGLTHLEAMQFGKPVVAFDAGGVKEYVKNCIVPLRDIDAMAAKVKELMEDENLRKKLGEENRENVLNNFTAEIMAKKYLKLFEKLI